MSDIKTEIFIKKANIIHNYRYDYSLTEYVNNKKHVIIICSNHGVFYQTPNMHLQKNGCKKCFFDSTKTIKAGDIFFNLTIISYTDRAMRSEYKCLCKCGNITYASTSALKSGRHKSCGCLIYENTLNQALYSNKIKSTVSRSYSNYKNSAKNKKLSFGLAKDFFERLVLSKCYYCGFAPEHNKINGIDRVDNTKGYEIWNCVSCCRICNYSKNNLVIQDWFNWLDRIFKYRKINYRL